MRKINSIKNMISSVGGQIVAISITFITRRVFVNFLSSDYLGINGLFSSIVNFLTLAELGIGIAIVYSLYSPIAKKDTNTVNAYLQFFKKAYRVIALIILLLGVLMLPLLNIFIGDVIISFDIYLIFGLFLVHGISNYIFAYKKSVLRSDQKSYLINIIHYTFIIVLNSLQILLLMIFSNYIMFLILAIIFKLSENLLITWLVNRRYPFVKNPEKVSLKTQEMKDLKKNIFSLSLHKFGAVVVNSTDNIVMSIYVGIYWVGLYSNYFMITAALAMILGQLFNSIVASVGNLIIEKNSNYTLSIFHKVLFANFYIYGFSAIMFYFLSSDFIALWLGPEYLLNDSVLIVIAISFFVDGTRRTSLIFKDAYGLFWNDRYKPIIQSIINVSFSIILAIHLGLVGIFLGTIISNILTTLWIEPYIVFKFGLKHNILEYFQNYTKYLITNIIIFLFLLFSLSFVNLGNLFNLFVKSIVIFISFFFIYWFFYRKNKNYKYFSAFLENIIIKLK
jgi:O-antigen/teichoic acid export membrane protein